MAEQTPPSEPTKPPTPAATPPLTPRTTAALELSKVIIPVVGTIIAACLSGVFLLINSGFFGAKDPTPTPAPTQPLVVIVQPTLPPSTPIPQPTATPVPPTPTAIAWTLRFEDDFSDPASGWPLQNDASVIKEYTDGGYLITMVEDNINTFSRNANAEILEDVRVEVDALQIGDESPWDIGLSCRINGMDVYDLSVYETGGMKKYGIYRWDEGYYETLAEKFVTDDRVFREGMIANQYRAECVGGSLSLWVNGEKVLEAVDPNPLPAGKSGIVTGYSTGVKVFYDNFAVYVP